MFINIIIWIIISLKRIRKEKIQKNYIRNHDEGTRGRGLNAYAQDEWKKIDWSWWWSQFSLFEAPSYPLCIYR